MKRLLPLIIFSCVYVYVLLQLNIIILKHSSQVIVASAAGSNNVVIDFAHQTATGSPLVFGGAHGPNLDHQDAWDLIANAGVTMIRRGFHIENELPKDITLDDYKNNKNNIQNPDNWNKTQINWSNSLYQNTQQREMKVMAVIAYSPAWLTYSGTIYGVPKDWQVYEDIVKKSYRLHRPYLDMIEIWNEPDSETFLEPEGSGLSREEAYALMFEHSVNAIKIVDSEIGDGKKILILAPAASLPNNTELFDYLLSKPISKYINGISVHSYGKDEPSWTNYLAVMKEYGRENLPIYVTEWNKTSDFIMNNKYVSGDFAIPFTGQKLVQFLKYGIAGANYYSTTYYDPSSQDKYSNSFGFYWRLNNQSHLLPQGKTWQLLSRSLSLGAGSSRIYQTSQPDNVETLGFNNSKSESGLAIVNENTTGQTIRVSLNNLNLPKNTTAKLFIASGQNDPTSPFCTQDASDNLSNPSFLVNLPPQSVVGITFTTSKISMLNTFLNILGASTSSNCLFGF